MSLWENIEDYCIEVDLEDREVNILVDSNESGNVYAILTFKQIENIYNKIQEMV